MDVDQPSGGSRKSASIWKNPFFSACALLGVAFVITVLAFVATMFGDPKSPVNQFLENWGTLVVAVEVGGIALTALLAMALDRWQTLRGTGDLGPRSSPASHPGQSHDQNAVP